MMSDPFNLRICETHQRAFMEGCPVCVEGWKEAEFAPIRSKLSSAQERIAELTRENHELALACEARDDERIAAQNRVVDLEREIEILRGK